MAANPARQPLLQFDMFELDPGENQLRRRGLPVELPPQALRILTLLTARPNELVTRKEIKEALWPGQFYGDFDSRLNFAIKKLREALGDDAEQPRYVQTVRNAGYRFIAPVREPLSPSSVPPNSKGQSRRGILVPGDGLRRGRRGLFVVLVAAVLVAVAAAAVAAVLALRQGRPSQALVEAKTLAASANIEYQPLVDSVSEVLPQARQKIIITGRGFGLHVPYVHTDSPYLAIRDLTARWAAGRIVPHNSDEVMLDVENWTDTEIVISGFSGDYGLNGWQLKAGDRLEIAIWNPQSGVGPALYRTTVVTPSDSH